jgi:hypothetical protein
MDAIEEMFIRRHSYDTNSDIKLIVKHVERQIIHDITVHRCHSRTRNIHLRC